MSTREGSYVVPATAASMERAARQLRQAFNDVFRYVPETERAMPRRAVEKFCRQIVVGEQPAPAYWHRENREVPSFATPEDRKRWQDGDKYDYRNHTMDLRITGMFRWDEPDDADAFGVSSFSGTRAASGISTAACTPENQARRARRVLAIRWHMESTYVYHALVDGQDVSGTLTEVWGRICAASEKAAES